MRPRLSHVCVAVSWFELRFLGRTTNDDRNIPRANAYQDGVSANQKQQEKEKKREAKKQAKQQKKERQMELQKQAADEMVYSDTLDEDAGAYEYISETQLPRERKIPTAGGSRY